MNTMNINEFKWIDCVFLNTESSEAFKFNYILLNTERGPQVTERSEFTTLHSLPLSN